jgi:glycosyltransferase involved in cell wall biosynthesis
MKRRIGILFPSSKKGGVYQYARGIADSLINHSGNYDFCIIHEEGKPDLSSGGSNDRSIDFVQIPPCNPSNLRKLIHLLSLYIGFSPGLIKNLKSVLEKASVDLLIVPTPLFFSIPLDVPFITSLPDHNDKYFPDFPEYSLKTKLARNIIFRYFGKNAVLVVADSETTVGDLERFSGVHREKTFIIPYIPPDYIYEFKDMSQAEAAILTNHLNLPDRYIFYPAQFWYQKNHFRLFKAIRRVRDIHNEKINLVLSGNSTGSPIYEKVYQELQTLGEELDIESQITYMGYTDNKMTVALYKRSVGLVSPALQAPTTIPPLEAMMLGVPVATVNLAEIPKQVGDAGLLFDPLDVEDIAKKTYILWTDAALREQMVSRGLEIVKYLNREWYAEQWVKAISNAFMRTTVAPEKWTKDKL